LGLAISGKVRSHTHSAVAGAGKGSVFTVRLPGGATH